MHKHIYTTAESQVKSLQNKHSANTQYACRHLLWTITRTIGHAQKVAVLYTSEGRFPSEASTFISVALR